MTAELRIPAAFRPGFEYLAGLDEAVFDAFKQRLEDAKPALLPGRLAEQVALGGGFDRKAVEDAIVAALSLLPLAENVQGSLSELIENVAQSTELTLKDSSRLGRERLATRLRTLLAVPTVTVSAKALSVVTAHEHPFHRARILSDIRPIFGADASEVPPAAAVIHTLDVGFHRRDGSVESFQVAMDLVDLGRLKAAVTRAEKKDAQLREMCRRAGVSLLDEQRA